MKSMLILLFLIALFTLLSFFFQKVRKLPSTAQLKHGWITLAIGWGSFTFVLLSIYAFFYDCDAWDKPTELLSIIGLFISFGLASIYLFIEYFKVYGIYDEKHIEFYTPWSGKKNEEWDNLITVKDGREWYVLVFKNGNKIRLSQYLNGFDGISEIIVDKMYDENTMEGANLILSECFEVLDDQVDNLAFDESLLPFKKDKIFKAIDTLLKSDIDQELKDSIDDLLTFLNKQ